LKRNAEVGEVETALRRSFPSLPWEVFGARTRARWAVWPRQIGMVALVDQYGLTLTATAQAIGKHHGTVHHAIKRVRDAAQVDRQAREDIKTFLKHLGGVRR